MVDLIFTARDDAMETKCNAASRRKQFLYLVLDLGLDIVDGVAALDLEGDGLPRQRLHEDLHPPRPPLAALPLPCPASSFLPELEEVAMDTDR